MTHEHVISTEGIDAELAAYELGVKMREIDNDGALANCDCCGAIAADVIELRTNDLLFAETVARVIAADVRPAFLRGYLAGNDECCEAHA